MLKSLVKYAAVGKSPISRGSNNRASLQVSRDAIKGTPHPHPRPHPQGAAPLLPKIPGITSYVTLLPDKAKLFRAGNPIVYAEAVADVIGRPQAGDEVFVVDHHGVPVGRGFYNQFSRFRVRLTALSREKEMSLPLGKLLRTRFAQALAVRETLNLCAFSSICDYRNADAGTSIATHTSTLSASAALSPLRVPSDTAFRLINSEGDGLGGLVVDVLGQAVVVQSSASWCEVHKLSIMEALQEMLCRGDARKEGGGGGGGGGQRTVHWKPSAALLLKDGFRGHGTQKIAGAGAGAGVGAAAAEDGSGVKHGSVNTNTAAEEEEEEEEEDCIDAYSEEHSDSDTDIDTGNGNGNLNLRIITEHDCKYGIRVEDGQKTGFYCDQRDNRQLIRQHARDKKVLDMYCYSGGFGINAIKGGAASVTAVDSSAAALSLAAANIQLNRMSVSASSDADGTSTHNKGSSIKLVRADAIAFMKAAVLAGEQYDIVICDPPKLAPTKKSLDRASGTYTLINTLAMQLVRPGGLLLTCTCSGAMTQDLALYHKVLLQAAKNAKKHIRILNQGSAALDHPVLPAFPEGSYLTSVLLSVQ